MMCTQAKMCPAGEDSGEAALPQQHVSSLEMCCQQAMQACTCLLNVGGRVHGLRLKAAALRQLRQLLRLPAQVCWSRKDECEQFEARIGERRCRRWGESMQG